MAHFPRGWGRHLDRQNVFQTACAEMEDVAKRLCQAVDADDFNNLTPQQMRVLEYQRILQNVIRIISTSRTTKIYFEKDFARTYDVDGSFQSVINTITETCNRLCLGNTPQAVARGDDFIAICNAVSSYLSHSPGQPIIIEDLPQRVTLKVGDTLSIGIAGRNIDRCEWWEASQGQPWERNEAYGTGTIIPDIVVNAGNIGTWYAICVAYGGEGLFATSSPCIITVTA